MSSFDQFPVPQATHDNVVVDGVVRYPETGIKVLVVGGGPGGLMTALECWRKGHTVEVLEKCEENSTIGDCIFISPSGWCTLKNYPSMLQDYLQCSWDCVTSYRQMDGTLVAPLIEFEWNRDDVPQHAAWPLRIRTAIGRWGLNKMFYNQCKRLGIKITFGVQIVDYVESITRTSATVVASDKREFTADIVVAADGLGSKSHTAVNSEPLRAFPTGYSVARAMYDPRGIPALEKHLQALQRSELRGYSGKNFHFVSVLADDAVIFGLTSMNGGDSEESWSKTVSTEEVLSRLPQGQDLDPLVLDMIRNVPKDQIISWQLCWRDPQPKWSTPHGRIIQIGDSAHAFVPSSIMGATTALEDAQSLAECLRLSGRLNAPVAVKVHEHLRLQRVSILQRLGLVNRREMHHEGGMGDTVKNATQAGPMGMAKWIWTHNPETYAQENFAQARSHLETGVEFQHTNIPKGFRWEAWSLEEELEKERQGIITPDLKLNGDWSIR